MAIGPQEAEPQRGPAAGPLSKLPAWTVPAVLAATVLAAILAAALVPEFQDQVLWRYYWGPIKADAINCSQVSHLAPDECATSSSPGILAHSGYNVVNTATWALLLGLCILGLAQLLAAFRTTMDARLIAAASAWVVAGSVAHVLEDVGLFTAPLQYFFITPPIYLLFGAFGVVAFLVGQWMRRAHERHGLTAATRILEIVHVAAVLLYIVLWWVDWPYVVRYLSPWFVILMAAASYAACRAGIHRAGVEPKTITALLCIGPSLLVGAYILLFIVDPWSSGAGGGMPSAVILAPALAALLVLPVWWLARLMHKRGSEAAWAFLVPLNLFLVFSQALDAFSTALGVDLHGYEEKHVVSGKVIEAFRSLSQAIGWDFGAEHPTFLGFVAVKLAVSLGVIWAIDVRGKQSDISPTMVGLVKFAIIMVGLGPGVRNAVRLSLGV